MAVYAFKPWQLRIYGGLLEIDRGLCFIGCEADGKKRDKADPKALKRAAERLAPFVRSFRERG